MDAPYAQPTSMEEWETFQPYAMWAHGREHDQVIRFDSYVEDDDQASFHVTRYADAERVLRDWETFSSSINGEVIGQYMGDLILAMNGKEHRQYRNLVAHAFRASVLDRWDAELVRPVIDELLDDDRAARTCRPRRVDHVAVPGAGDLRHRRRPARGPRAVRGVGGGDQHRARSSRTRAWPRRGRCASTSSRWSRASRRADGRPAVASSCTPRSTASASPTRRSTASSGCSCRPARETTFRVMGNALYALLTHPDDLARVVADPDALLPEVIEETLRWETSVTMVSRVAAVDTEIAGCPIAPARR